jgi:hypothetical protein
MQMFGSAPNGSASMPELDPRPSRGGWRESDPR